MGDDFLVGAGDFGVGLTGGGDDMIVGSGSDTLRYDLEEEMEAEAILGEALNRSYHHVEVNLGDGSVDLNKILIDSKVLLIRTLLQLKCWTLGAIQTLSWVLKTSVEPQQTFSSVLQKAIKSWRRRK